MSAANNIRCPRVLDRLILLTSCARALDVLDSASAQTMPLLNVVAAASHRTHAQVLDEIQRSNPQRDCSTTGLGLKNAAEMLMEGVRSGKIQCTGCPVEGLPYTSVGALRPVKLDHCGCTMSAHAADKCAASKRCMLCRRVRCRAALCCAVLHMTADRAQTTTIHCFSSGTCMRAVCAHERCVCPTALSCFDDCWNWH